MSFYPLDSPLTVGLADAGSTVPVKDAPAGQALLERQTKIFSRKDLLGIQSSFVTQMLERGIQSLCCIPLTTRKGELGTLNLASQDANAFAAKDIGFLEQVAAQVAVAEITRGRRIADSNETLESMEREYIIRMLREANGVIAGPHGAAARLGMKRTTLQSRIVKLGITREEY
jgi:transcriptional regulator with GAF, ATPase, and Fis domain